MADHDMEQRTRLAAGMLGCAETEVLGKVQAMDLQQKRSLSACITWLVDYETVLPHGGSDQ